LLDDPQVATAARNALEHIPDPAADQTLRERLVKLHGPARIGVIHSLGARRSTSSVRLLTRQLKGPHADIAAAAAAALGDIDSPGAARALRSFFPKAAPQLRPALSDALLACAERSAGEGNPAEARSLYQLLLASPGPKHVQSAASLGLARCAVAP
jgi:HEAT repeat protein